ncbi:Dolichyl-phosphate-mannose-protein mannosyltransferase [Persephonella hydrogeniphila]|uniref:Dolichyl-phosphate-mannose-protein mannosyltransferase n=1 Tax=Persephonella hydrogeniphila TaxID=198703 RepID=A0A285NF71_9AQUI|nr:glycosyltransferase family 39 protein [Persephonella hydrogeniphila]SNZ07918.1 Dolichyl-phosphate-mannose-protein mannosyltransferase [Persephonella hydrogeniphila]
MIYRVFIVHGILAVLKIVYTLLNITDLSTEEAQYWVWSKNLDIGYYSKPPLIAYMNFISTSIFGDTELGVRINAIFIGFAIGILVFVFVREIFKDEKLAFFSSVLITAVPAFQVGSYIFLTDSPLAFFWILTIYLFYRAVNEKKPVLWVLTGVSAGLGFLSKFLIVLFLPPALLFLYLFKREIFRERWFYFSVLIASLFTVPVIIWNFQHDFVTFKHVFNLGEAKKEISLSKSAEYIGNYIASQIGLNSVFLFPFFFYAVYRGFKERKNFRIFYLWIFPVFIFLVFLYIARKKNVEANWPAFGYATLYILTAYYIYMKKWFKGFIFAFVLSIWSIFTLFYPFYLDKIGLGKIYPPKVDPLHRLVGWEGLGKKVSEVVKDLKTDKYFVFSESYHIASELWFYMEGNPRTYCVVINRRMNQFDLWPGIEQFEGKGYTGIYVSRWGLPKKIRDSFRKVKAHYRYDIIYRGWKYRTINIYVLEDLIKLKQDRFRSY